MRSLHNFYSISWPSSELGHWWTWEQFYLIFARHNKSLIIDINYNFLGISCYFFYLVMCHNEDKVGVDTILLSQQKSDLKNFIRIIPLGNPSYLQYWLYDRLFVDNTSCLAVLDLRLLGGWTLAFCLFYRQTFFISYMLVLGAGQ